jgi:hypothetical protein
LIQKIGYSFQRSYTNNMIKLLLIGTKLKNKTTNLKLCRNEVKVLGISISIIKAKASTDNNNKRVRSERHYLYIYLYTKYEK